MESIFKLFWFFITGRSSS